MTAKTDNYDGLVLKVVAITFSRLIVNTARRFAYTFAPVISRGLGVPLTSVTSIIALNQATGILGVVFGPVADRYGNRLVMALGLFLLAAGLLSAGIFPVYTMVLVGLVLAGLGKTMFDPAMQGFVGQRVPFRRRGLVVGILETSWAGSTLIGIPLMGLLIDRYGWRSPFWALGAAGLIALVAVRLLLRGGGRGRAAAGRDSLFRMWARLASQRASLGTLLFGFFINAGNDCLFVVYGAWLESAFSLSVLALGAGAMVIGVAELGGESIIAAFGDRMGLLRTVRITLVGTALSYIILPLIGQSVLLAFVGLFIIFLFFETTIVGFLSLCTELLPEARATIMAGFLAAAGLGRVVGALLGGPAWLAGGLWATGLLSMTMTFLSLAALTWGLAGWTQESE